MLRVLVADDSPLAREMITSVINDDPGMIVAGVASGGRETIRKAHELKPDLITMDLVMPDMDGVEATRVIMTRSPTPIVMISSTVTAAFGPTHFDALAVGAVDVVEKPDFTLLRMHPGLRRKFQENLRAMSQVVTVTRRNARDDRTTSPPPSNRPRRTTPLPQPEDVLPSIPHSTQLIVVGASTGGPPAVAQCLRLVEPAGAPPIVLVQHMARGFIEGFADWLDRQIGPRVRIARDGEVLSSGSVYVAPDDHHVAVTGFGRLSVFEGPPLRYHRPSVDVLFRSAATHYQESALGVLLTGMGDDGARGLAAMHQEGALTLAQDRESSVVWGMPGAAVERGAVSWSGDCTTIAEALRGVRVKRQQRAGDGS